MPEFNFDFLIQFEYFEPNSMAPVEEGYGHLRYYDTRIDDLLILGTMHYSQSLLPNQHRGTITDYEVTMSWFDSPQDIAQTIGETRSVVELRADYMGIRSRSSDSAWFVFRELESADYESRKGIMDVYPGRLPEEQSMEFLDRSAEFKKGTLGGDPDVTHEWPMGEPYESYYVLFEFELSPGALDDPPRKQDD